MPLDCAVRQLAQAHRAASASRSEYSAHGPSPGASMLLHAYRRLMPEPNRTVIDVGANTGQEALEALSLWGHQWERTAAQHIPGLCARERSNGERETGCVPSPMQVAPLGRARTSPA